MRLAPLLRDEARAGRLDGDAVEGVLRAAGHRARRRREWPAGLTSREVEVLRLVARGLSHKQIAEQLVISRKTASHHVEHIYTKIGVSNRAMAALFAMKHGLIGRRPREAVRPPIVAKMGCAPDDRLPTLPHHRRHDDYIGTDTIDDQAVEEFAGRLFELFTGAALSCLIDIGHRTGLFEAAADGSGHQCGVGEPGRPG